MENMNRSLEHTMAPFFSGLTGGNRTSFGLYENVFDLLLFD